MQIISIYCGNNNKLATYLIFLLEKDKKCWPQQSRDIPYHHLAKYFTSTYFAVKSPSIFSRIRLSIGAKGSI